MWRDLTGKEVIMKNMRRFAVVGFLSLLTMIGYGATPGIAQPRAHVYLLRGLMNVFSLGMDTLAEKIQRHGIYATVHNHTEWEALADQAAAAYRAGKEGPIIIVGHSLGADAVMQMSAYLGRKGVSVALAVPFDARGSYATSSNVMSRGAGFRGSLSNVDVSSDRNIDHLNIDKSARLHTQVLTAIVEVVGNGSGNQRVAPTANDHNAQRSITTPESGQNGAVKSADSPRTPLKSDDSVTNSVESVSQHGIPRQ
jgi:hypothetical protein